MCKAHVSIKELYLIQNSNSMNLLCHSEFAFGLPLAFILTLAFAVTCRVDNFPFVFDLPLHCIDTQLGIGICICIVNSPVRIQSILAFDFALALAYTGNFLFSFDMSGLLVGMCIGSYNIPVRAQASYPGFPVEAELCS